MDIRSIRSRYGIKTKAGEDITDGRPWHLPQVINLDEMFLDNEDAVLINNVVSPLSENIADEINKCIFKENRLSDIGFVAECPCGHIKDNKSKGIICPKCKEKVESGFTNEFMHKTWIGVPDGIPGFIHPTIYFMLFQWLKRGKSSKESYLQDILNTNIDNRTYNSLPEDVQDMAGKGFKWFYDNFDYVINFFANQHSKTRKRKATPFVLKLVSQERDKIFCTKLPILSKELHPISKDGDSLKYKDAPSNNVARAVIDLISINLKKTISNVKHSKLEEITYGAYNKYINYCRDIMRDKFDDKYGILIQHIYGSRLHMSMRGVIRPIIGEHDGDELHIPWKMGLNGYKLHIINLLMNRKGYSNKAAIDKHEQAFLVYDYEIDQIMQTIIKEATAKIFDEKTKRWKTINLPGLPVLFGRNPGLNPGSIQNLYITKIGPSLKRKPLYPEQININDETIGLSTMVVKPYNADFDGDEMNTLPIIEMEYFNDIMRAFHPMGLMVENDTKSGMNTDAAWLTPSEIIQLNGFLEDI